MPNLAVTLIEITDVDLYENFGLQIVSYGAPLVVDFPSLCNATGINILGYIERYRQSFR
jgi:hypothetical protein